jgi:hypothetical protein
MVPLELAGLGAGKNCRQCHQARPRMVEKLDLGESTRSCQVGFDEPMTTLRDDFLCDVTLCYVRMGMNAEPYKPYTLCDVT